MCEHNLLVDALKVINHEKFLVQPVKACLECKEIILEPPTIEEESREFKL